MFLVAAAILPVTTTLAQPVAQARIEAETSQVLDAVSPAPLRLAVLMLVLRAYERGERDMPIRPVEAWIAPYRQVRL